MKRIPVERFHRIVGYYRMASDSNKGKQEEIRQRKYLDISKYKNEMLRDNN